MADLAMPPGTPASAPPSPTSTSPCRPWCAHDSRFPGEHESAPTALPAPAGMPHPTPDLLTTLIHTTDEGHGPWVVVRADGNSVFLDADEAETFADDLIAFALEIRRQARLVRTPEVAR